MGPGYLKFLLAVESPQGEIYGFLLFNMNYTLFIKYGQETCANFEQLLVYLIHFNRL